VECSTESDQGRVENCGMSGAARVLGGRVMETSANRDAHFSHCV
jgi:hypothetical protein